MPDINATPSDPAANSYLTIAEADELIDGFEHGDKWDDLDEDAKARLLVEATRKVDQYGGLKGGWGPTKVSSQRLAFPRRPDTAGAIPEAVKLAVCEYLNFKLEGSLVALKKLQEEGVTSATILGQSQSFGADLSGLPAGARRQLDALLKAHWPVGTVHRDGECTFFG